MISQELSNCDSRKAVEYFCKNILTQRLETYIQEIADYALEAVKELEIIEKEALDGFWNEFEKTYKELKALEVEKLNYSFKKEKQLTISNDTDFDSVGQEIQKLNSNASMYQKGGMAIGAVIGSFILPGIGTGIGAALGELLGTLFTPSLESIKEKTWTQIAPDIDKSYENAISYISERINSYDADIQNHVKQQISNCIKEYGDLINALIEQDEKTKKSLNIKIKEIQADMKRINAKL